jgi:hypothetical protein
MRKTKILRRKQSLGKKRRYSRKKVRTSRKMKGGAPMQITRLDELETMVKNKALKESKTRCWITDNNSKLLPELTIPDIDSREFSAAKEFFMSSGYRLDCL